MRARYAAFFRYPGVVRLAAPAALARLPEGMVNLALVLVIQAATGSYGIAGAGPAAYAVAAGVFSPVWGRTADRVGLRPVVTVTGAADAAVFAGMFVVAVRAGPAGLLVGLAGAAGLARPPIGTVTRTVWSRMLPDEPREVAFTYEATAIEVVFIAGPAIVGGFTAVAAPRLALLLGAVIVLAGCAGIATAPVLSAPAVSTADSGQAGRDWLGPLRHGRVLVVLPVGMLGQGSIAVIEIATVGFADEAGSRAASGFLLALLSTGGIIGGLVWAARRQPGTHVTQLAVLLILLGLGWLILSLPAGIIVFAVVVLAVGLVMNWVTTVQLATMSDFAPRDSVTEAFGWLAAAIAIGEGLGAAAAGVVVELHPDYGFWLAAAMTAAASALTFTLLIRHGPGRNRHQTKRSRLS